MNPFHPLESRLLFAAGDPDPSFGEGGVVTEAPAQIQTNDATITAGDKILVAGGINDIPSDPKDYFLRRFNADGTPDATFGIAGTARGRLSSTSGVIASIELAQDGKILAIVNDNEGEPASFIARFNTDGSLDTTFSDDGFFEFNRLDATAVGVQSDGAVLLAVGNDVSRYTSTGVLDTTFGTGGTAQDLFDGSIFVLHPLSDGSILVGGGVNSTPQSQLNQMALAKLTATGTLDTTFSSDGKVIMQLPGVSTTASQPIRDIDVQSNGRIVVTVRPGLDSAAVRFLANGDLDTAFGDQGSTRFYLNATPLDSYIDSNGLIYVTAFGGGVARLTTDGDLDDTFGRVLGGGPDTSTGFGGRCAGLLSTGQIMIAGTDSRPGSGGNPLVLVARLSVDDGNPSPITLSGNTLTISGTSGNDKIVAQDFPALITTLNGFGRIFETADVDLVVANCGDGDDSANFDELDSTSVQVNGGNGSDRITGGDKNDTLAGNAQRDFLDGGTGADLVTGNGGNDQLRGQGGADRVYGGAGNDYVEGSGGNDKLRGDAGTDNLVGNGGDDAFFTDDGEIDSLFGDGGNDTGDTDNLDVLTSVESTT